METMKYLQSDVILNNHNDEIDGLNKKLLEMLKNPPNLECTGIGGTRYLATANSDIQYCAPLKSCYDRYNLSFPFYRSTIDTKSQTHYLLPIGVFWDIENCPVPKGKSAAAVTQVIRESFFNGYREAEFIVVCDIHKENKQVIQELNDAQVNLIHVAATYKNAADEKLKQSIRRFADIHGSSAAIILISSDINFAADLSDLRHRRKMRIILLHNENSSEALILCAHDHYNFMELMGSLPNRGASKPLENYDLLVSNFPKYKCLTSVKRRLKQLSDNCGGRVIGINSDAAIIRFGLQESADRAQKRMNGELVFDTKIDVRSVKNKKKRIVEEVGNTSTSPIQMYTTNSAFTGIRCLPGTPHYHSSSPDMDTFANWNGVHCASAKTHTGVMPSSAAIFMGRPYSLFNNGDFVCNNRIGSEISRQSPIIWQMAGNQQFGQCWEDVCKIDRSKNFGKRIQCPSVRENSSINNSINNGNRTPEGMRRIRGSHSFFNYSHDRINAPRQIFSAPPVPNNYNTNNFVPANTFRRRSPSPMYIKQNRDAGQGQHGTHSVRNISTPSPYSNINTIMQMNQQTNCSSPYSQNGIASNEAEYFFNPINNRTCSNGINSGGTYMPIELQVTNLDQNIDSKEMKRILYSIFMEHVMLLHVCIFMQSDGNYAASVKVASLSDAQYAISQLHRRKIGFKRILISYAHTSGPNPQLLRSQIVMLLQEVPGHKLPLFKFREMYESRFMISISISELYKMKDVCIVTEDPSGRMVSLNPDHRNTPSPRFGNIPQEKPLELPYCITHTQKPWSDKGWAEQEVGLLPNVMMSLKVLGVRLHQLLTTHNGTLPLSTLPNCYEAEFKEPLIMNENGVPLEHLVSCLKSIEIKQGGGSVKSLMWHEDKNRDEYHDNIQCVSPALATQLALFSRELIDLLKTASHCQIPFNRFIPAYHHHFGRQCRVADYGFTKLIDLLEALTNTVQVMGEGNNRVVTLSHRAQIRRFTSDLLRVLKAQASKQITLSEFPTVYARVIAKPWDPVDYGVCEIDDILSGVSENTVVVTNVCDIGKVIAIPKREQTPEEIERTKQFSAEVVELLRHAPQCTMLFNKFVPSYHHHFGHQCRVSDYGFTKLIELFEAIPHIVKIEDVIGGERRISLTEHESLGVLGEQISKLVKKSRGRIALSNISQYFLRQFGYMLRPKSYNCNSTEQLIKKLNDCVKIVESSGEPIITLVDKLYLRQLALQCRRILMDQSRQRLPVKEFNRIYHEYYGYECDVNDLKRNLTHVVEFSVIENVELINLTLFQRYACNVYRVMLKHGGKLNLQQFETAYNNVIGSKCDFSQFQFPTLLSYLEALSCTVVIKETRQKKKILILNKDLAAVGIPLALTVASPYKIKESDNNPIIYNSYYNNTSRKPTTDELISRDLQTNWYEGYNFNLHHEKENYWTTSSDSDVIKKKWPPLEENDEYPVNTKSFIHKSEYRDASLLKKTSNFDSLNNGQINTITENKWKSSVWETPPKCSQQTNTTNVDVPPLILPAWNQLDDATSNLMSPMKNLLPAAANPLNLCSSSFFSVNNVIAPHPSELPLPSLSLASKRAGTHLEQKNREERMDHRTLGNSIEVHSPTNSENCTLSESDISDILNTTPSQRLFGGKRRLAAQFNQSVDL